MLTNRSKIVQVSTKVRFSIDGKKIEYIVFMCTGTKSTCREETYTDKKKVLICIAKKMKLLH